MTTTNYHNPVLLQQSVALLITNPDGIYVDCTFGGGGHSKEILTKLSSKGKLFAFDQDLDSLHNTINDDRFTLVNQNFRYVKNFLKVYQIEKTDGILADLGVSSHQFDSASRGFSTRFDGKLDMRMNSKQNISAHQIINEYAEEKLAEVLYNYGELRQSKKMAREIVVARQKKSIKTTQELKSIFNYIPKKAENKFFAQLFQAIRIEVNQELQVLKELLLQTEILIKPKGRIVMISYHSLEDRLVKNFFKKGLFEGEPQRDIYGNWSKPFTELQSKAIIPSQEEISENSRARSAKMRVAEKN